MGKEHHAFFFAFELLSTIGYGDIAPTTLGGRVFTVCFALLSIPYAGVVFGRIVGSLLTAVEMLTLIVHPSYLTAFCKYDVDSSHYLDETEFREALADVGIDSLHCAGLADVRCACWYWSLFQWLGYCLV